MGHDDNAFKQHLEAAVRSFVYNYNDIVKDAVKYAANKARERIQSKAIECLHQYYQNYDPKYYVRDSSDPIIRSFKTFKSIQWVAEAKYGNTTFSGYNVVAGVRYDTSVLTMYHSEQGSYNPVDGTFVFDNFMNGWHPGTNGSKKKYPNAQEWKNAVKKYGQIDSPSKQQPVAYQTMHKYLSTYTEQYFDKDFQWYLLQLIG